MKRIARSLLCLVFLEAPALPARSADPAPQPPSVSYSGTLVSLATSGPLAGAEVEAYPRLSTEEIRGLHAKGKFDLEPGTKAVTDASGRFSISLPTGESFFLVASAHGHLRSRLGRALSSLNSRNLGTFDLEPGRSARGKVLDADGKPVAGALLVAAEPPEPMRVGRGFLRGLAGSGSESFPVFARSAADGSFALEGLPSSRVILRVYASGFSPAMTDALSSPSGVVVRLRPGVELEGRVVGADGKTPEAGAWVLAGDETGSDGATRSREDGTFTLGDLHPGSITVMAAAGPPPVSPKGAAKPIDRLMEAPSKPVALEVPRAVAAPSNGGSSKQDAGKGKRTASSAAPGKTAAKTGQLVLKLRPGGMVSARAIDALTRKPIAHARVTLVANRESRPREEETGADGAAILAGVPPGPVMLFADADEYFRQSLPAVPLAAGQNRRLSAAMQPAALVEGTVRDLGGRPVAGATISVTGPPPARLRLPVKMSFPIGVDPVTSDREGRFTFEELPPGLALDFAAEAPGYVPWSLEGLRLKPHEKNRSLEILLDPGTTLSGTLVNEDGEPVAAASVKAGRRPEGGGRGMVFRMAEGRRRGGRRRAEVSTGTGGADSLPSVLSDEKGRFRIGGVRDGVWSLEISSPGFAPKEVGGLKVEGGQGVDAGQITLTPGATIRGHVKNTSGDPIPYASVSITKMIRPIDEVTSDTGGAFETGDLVPGEVVDLRVTADGYGSADLPGLSPPVEDVDVTLPFTSKVTGRVLDKESREPIKEFRIAVSKERSLGGGGMRVVMNSAGPEESFDSDDGKFRIEGVDPGRISVTASAEGYKDAVLRDLTVEAGSDLDGIVLQLDRGAIISGTVTDERGIPVPGASVSRKESTQGRFARGMGAGREGDSVTDGDGNFLLEGLDRGRMTLDVEKDGYEPADVDVDTTHDVEGLGIVLSGGSSLTGTVVRDEDGSPIPGATVSASAAGTDIMGSTAPVTTGPGGNFEIGGLSDGRYTLRAEAPGLHPGEVQNVVVRAGTPSQPYELRLGGGVTLSGTVTRVKPDEIQQLSVRAFASGGGGFGVTAPVDDSGAFEMKGLSPGTYTLIASTGMLGGRSASKTVEIPEGTDSVDTVIEFPKGSRVEGVVTRGENPVGGASVIFVKNSSRTTATATTDASGKYSVGDMEDGDYAVHVLQIQTGLSHTTKVTVSGDTSFDIDLPLAKLSGEVRDAGSGDPLEGARIALKRTDAGPSTGSGLRIMGRGAVTDASGLFDLEGLDAGDYELTATKDGYGFVVKPVQIISGVDPGPVTFDLSPVEGITFRALDGASGVPLRSLSALVVLGGGDPLAAGGYGGRVIYRGNLAADGSGLFTLSSLQPGSYSVVLGGQGLATLTLHGVRAPSQEQSFTLFPGGSIEVRAPGLSGNDTAHGALFDETGQAVFLRPFSTEPAFTLSAGAALSLQNVPPGEYTLRVILPQGGLAEKAVKVDAGSTAQVSVP